MQLRQAKLHLKRLRKPLWSCVRRRGRTAYLSEAAQIAKLSLKYQLPSMHQVRAEAEAGGLMSYGPDITDL
jgi:hypothetical protein